MSPLRFTSKLALLAVVALGACSKEAPPPPAPAPRPVPATTLAPAPVPFKLVSVEVGKSVGDDKRIKETASTFGTHDTIYAAVSTEGASPKATLKARWTFGAKGTLVNEETRDIAPTGPAVTEFHIAKPSGWPVGNYKIEVSADGGPATTLDFVVQK